MISYGKDLKLMKDNGDDMILPEHARYCLQHSNKLINLNKLTRQIEVLREQMAEVAFEKGFTSSESIAKSQELDKLLNLYEAKRKI